MFPSDFISWYVHHGRLIGTPPPTTMCTPSRCLGVMKLYLADLIDHFQPLSHQRRIVNSPLNRNSGFFCGMTATPPPRTPPPPAVENPCNSCRPTHIPGPSCLFRRSRRRSIAGFRLRFYWYCSNSRRMWQCACMQLHRPLLSEFSECPVRLLFFL